MISLLFVFQPFPPLLAFLLQPHSISYIFPQTSGHVLCSYLYLYSLPGISFSIFQANSYLTFRVWIRHQLLQATLPNSPSPGRQVLCIHSFTQQAFVEHLGRTSLCARSRKAVMKRKVASCAGSSYILIRETGDEQKQASQQIKERQSVIIGMKKISLGF